MEDIWQGWRLWGQHLRCSAWGPEPLRRGGLCPPAPLPHPCWRELAGGCARPPDLGESLWQPQGVWKVSTRAAELQP